MRLQATVYPSFRAQQPPTTVSLAAVNRQPAALPGVGLRDYFAGCIISGYIARGNSVSETVAKFAYQGADNMIAARNKNSH